MTGFTSYNACAALTMKSATLFGCDTMGTWLDWSSIVFAFIIFASALANM